MVLQVTANEDGTAHFEGFQVSKQCMEMVAEGALEIGELLLYCRCGGDRRHLKDIVDTWTAVSLSS